ncbi:bifunctional diguanylate cyclase/phosphodiesterase [Sporosarcina luteola]|uniref:bifunctional diguanylate cyclase/phosphodiesterase n=1 Tax=Sporosarcina luteola TaxID=582850 RepID=UPI0011BEE50C|nr:bifunctional diguanylate cyclase/phosphodiesterase [Sporosarcina luteola]
MEGTYNIYIVALSVIIAVLASYSALNIAAKISNANGKMKYFWLFSGSFVMGSGVWSMHFIGMLAFEIHANMDYDASLTLLSMIASVLSSFIAFYITMPQIVDMKRLILGGFTMGSGIVAMHYIGMEAMIMPMELSYDKGLLLLSVVIAFIASYAALFLFLRFKNQRTASWLKWLSAIIMGTAICGMHYTGLKAARFHSHSHLTENTQGIDLFLLYSVLITTLFILFISWGAMFFDRNVLEKMAYQDAITGLPNRNEMNKFFDTFIGNETIGVLFIDLDKFKVINDTIGHDMGDLLISEVGARLQQFIRKDQRVFRIGGDEFLLVVKHCDEKWAEQLAKEILLSIKDVYRIEGNELYITASIGISIGTITSSNRFTLLKAADMAMYRAKKSGKNRYCLYNDALGLEEVRKMELEKDLQSALENNQFYIVYQPKWNVKTNRLYGFEALLRWEHPRLGVISPAEFIPITEETGLIVPITKWILEKVCHQCITWQTQGELQPVSVNLSNRLFQSGRLKDMVQNALEKANLKPHLLELEITESMVFYDVEDIILQLDSIRALGVRISMDDFGTGYSSIGLLDRMPIDTLKLDRLFTNDLDTPRKRAIMNAIIVMADDLQLDLIAEGVENEEHIESLTQLGCYLVQGYFYGKPMKVGEINKLFFNLNDKQLRTV